MLERIFLERFKEHYQGSITPMLANGDYATVHSLLHDSVLYARMNRSGLAMVHSGISFMAYLEMAYEQTANGQEPDRKTFGWLEAHLAQTDLPNFWEV